MEQMVVQMVAVKKKRRNKIIGPLNLSIPQGYVVVLVGENGSGKSTMMNMLMQTVIPDEGDITWFGQSYPSGIPPEIKQQIGYVSEKSNLEEDLMTAQEVAKFRSYWYTDWDDMLLQKLFKSFNIPANTKLNKMSKGERRKVEISVALASRPKLLLLDEPSSGLDPFAWKRMIDELQEYMAQGESTILLSTHIVDEIRRLADFIILVHQGRILGMVEKDSLLDNWKEVWVKGDSSMVEDLPGIVSAQQESIGVLRLITTECKQLENLLQQSGIQLMKTRGLELDEILSLWIQRDEAVIAQSERGE
ncbi:ABC transporter ATP-binding protein [Paenibacillus macquariensis]|uniref:ABC-2 type transport system ATP-binding protein n=1 Tax=Paenibacillus macquariensis TaxID=948756 RepID=A0ABY1K907_9BACL|nr:ABC transporter ATP-binding protein [Paenibacillus macquariensis]MEC0091515.1 ABC transporter ATP-binding protein [Paenibacillus macquariensis]OAB26647.1 multidrug ABC transporter ATP-binding protein [Paenibacillus macquariensis subsp. macquariensis]SIR43963.1 ABC-2 type transport system ATP-binding protein [Paenibacillus macquariensis]